MFDSEYDKRASIPDYKVWLDNDADEPQDPTSFERYNTEDYISGPFRVENGTVPMNILEFYHSYAYDCQRYFNLCVADPKTVIFASGNLIHFFNTVNGDIWFRRCSTGGGIGHIAKNPTKSHIAIGEIGIDPPIIIYEWPSMEIVTILNEGTTRSYSHLAYSPDGILLLSQGGDPDYMITLWNWEKSKILLRCKSHGQDINNAMFSPTVTGHLTTSGAGHIKFWKIARTFTGLKLKGQLGRFGKTEISDIIGVYSMPDEKVVSGCEWGNILLWDEDLIKLEVCKKNRKPCHGKMITQFEYNNGELVSVGMDGWIRVWYYETIDLADPPDEDRFLEIEPIYEFQVKKNDDNGDEEGSMLMSMQKQNPEDPENTSWYAQDGNGSLWLLNLGSFENPKQPRKLFTCHAGPITCMDVASWGPFVTTCGKDGHLHIYNYSAKKLILIHKFRDKGCSGVVWFPCSVEATGSTLVCSFENGLVRTITVAVTTADRADDIHGDYVRLIQVVKPHTSAITAMSVNSSNSLLITGSVDSTIFVFSVRTTDTHPNLVPIGYVRLASEISCMTWKPQQRNVILVGCSHGDCAEIELPEEPQNYTIVSYELVRCEPKFFKFQSVKSKIRRESVRLERERKKEAKREAKREIMEKMRIDNPGIEIDEEAYLMETDDDQPLPDIHIPEIPNSILMANYTVVGTIWLSMAGYDAGYMYEYSIPEKSENVITEPMRSTMIFDADDTEIRNCLSYNEKYLFMGMQNGEIRVCRINPKDHTDFSDYWMLPMHDNANGRISGIVMSHDNEFLLTCGHDGNLFSYVINDDDRRAKIRTEKAKKPRELPEVNVEDIEEPDHPSLEQVIVRSENDRISSLAKNKKEATLKLLGNLTEEYNEIVERNRRLPKSQQMSQEDFELDPRITADLNDQLKAEMDLVREKMAFKVEKSRLGLKKLMDHFVEPITCLPFAVCRILKPDSMVYSLRERKLEDNFATTYADVVKKIEEKDEAGRPPDVKIVEEAKEEEEKKSVQGLESFLKGLSPTTVEHRMGVQINQMLRKYRARKARMEERAKEWKIIFDSKPDPNVNHPDDVAAIDHAKKTIGDYKLKTNPDYSQFQKPRETTLTKYKQLLEFRKKTHRLREDFNVRLKSVRDEKIDLQNEVLELIEKLKIIHAEIPERKIKPLPDIPIIDYEIEFPEKNLELEKYTSRAERVRETKRKKMSVTEETMINPMDEEYEVLLLDEKSIMSELDNASKNLNAKISDKLQKSMVTVPPEILESLNVNDHTETVWERELKRSRATRKINEQDAILKHVRTRYESFDEKLNVLDCERLEIMADSVYANLFTIVLNRELLILKDFESMENRLTDVVAEKSTERDTAEREIETMAAALERKNREISRLHDTMKNIDSRFASMIVDDKFANFLRRIYRRKFKIPRNDDDESSSSASSSSESSSDADEASVESDDIGIVHLDENVCPVGCDREIYDAAFAMREQRYDCENRAREEQRTIDSIRKDIELRARKLKVVENELNSSRKDFEDFMREKQTKLNDIDMTVILKFHQLRHFVDETKTARIRDCVVFDKTKLAQLYTRVGELQQETLEQKEKHKKNRTHLHRMKVDCKHMDAEIKRLKDKIKQEMMQKFGREVNLSSLYETVLRRMIHDMKADVKEIIKEYDEQIRCVKDKYHERVEVLENLVQDNTEKLSFLTVLEEEQTKLRKILRQTPETEEKILQIETEYRDDLARLESILKSQKHQKRLLRNDIRNLRLKTRPLPPICKDGSRVQRVGNKSEKENEDINFVELDITQGDQFVMDTEQFDSEDSENNENVQDGNDIHVKAVAKEENNEKNGHTAVMVHDWDITLFEEGRGGEKSLPMEEITEQVRRLLSRVIEGSSSNNETEETIREILTNVLEDLPDGGTVNDIRAQIERSVDRIIAAPSQENESATVEATKRVVKESLNEIVSRLEDESRNVEEAAASVDWKIKQRMDDLLDSMGIKQDGNLQITLMKLLRSSGGIEIAIDYLSRNVQTTPDTETLAVLREHALRTLTEIKTEMDASGDSPDPQEERIDDATSPG